MQGPFPTPQELIAELNHQINNPLAAIRNALYLAGSCSQSPELHQYLEIADVEINAIVHALTAARNQIEQAMHPNTALSGKAAAA